MSCVLRAVLCCAVLLCCRPSGRKRKAGSSLGSFLSPEMQDFLGERRMPRTQVGGCGASSGCLDGGFCG